MSLHPQARALRNLIRDPNCTACPLHDGAMTVCLTGDGAVPARLAIYGEAPGENEDMEGQPFIGRSGQLLDRELKAVGIDRRESFVSNVVKCRPPGNDTPGLKEIKACHPYAEAELAAVQPEVVLLLGNSALRGMTGKSGIMKQRGSAITGKDGRIYLPTMHPAAVLRTPGLLPAFRDDLQTLKRLLEGSHKPPQTTTKIVSNALEFDTLCRLLVNLPPNAPLLIDVEAGPADATYEKKGRPKAGLEPWADDYRVWCLGFRWDASDEGTSWVMPIDHPEGPIAKGLLRRQPTITRLGQAMAHLKLGGHNAAEYDRKALMSLGINVPIAFDTLLMAHLLDENRANGLKPLAITLLGAEPWSDEIDHDKLTPLPKLAEYNGKDVHHNLALYHLFKQQLAAQPRLARIYHFITLPAANALAEIEMVGFPVRLRRLKARNEEIERKLEAVESKLLEHVPEEQRAKANFRSVPFLQRWLFGKKAAGGLGLPVVKLSAKTHAPSTDEEVILELADHNPHPALDLLLEHRGLTKWHGTYTGAWITKIKTLGRPRLHPTYNVTGTVTGRLSSNMQQIPRNNLIRGIIAAPDGWTLVECDFSQIELRIAAMVSGEKTMIAAYQNGEDLHMLTAMAITGKPADEVTKEERARAKPVNFGFLYGMGWANFIPYARAQFGIVLTESESRSYRDAFFNRYPGLVVWHERMRRTAHRNQQVVSPIGRVRRLPDIASSDKGVVGDAERQAINSPVQGLASDMTLLAIPRIHDQVDSSVARIIGQVHDSILLEVRVEHAEQTAATVKEIMETLPVTSLFGWKPNVPIVADTKIHRFWGGE